MSEFRNLRSELSDTVRRLNTSTIVNAEQVDNAAIADRAS